MIIIVQTGLELFTDMKEFGGREWTCECETINEYVNVKQ